MFRNLCVICLTHVVCLASNAQYATDLSFSTEPAKHDTSYYVLLDEQLTTRFYFSKKFTGFHVNYPQLGDLVLKYAPNTSNNLGVGASYQWATLNLAYGWGFINPDRGQGDTRYLDLQMHQYLRKFNIDTYGQFYRGYYLRNDRINEEVGNTYVRDDIRVNEFGISGQYVFNHDRLSFRASFVNNAVQKKTAGSLLLGWDIYYGYTSADSTLIPYVIPVDPLLEYDGLRFFKTGPNVGYGFTIVVKKHFYITGSLTAHFNGGFYQLETGETDDRQGYFSVDLGTRVAVGYNTGRFTIGAFFVNQRVQVTSNYRNILNVGNIRGIITYRFNAPDFLPKLFNSE